MRYIYRNKIITKEQLIKIIEKANQLYEEEKNKGGHIEIILSARAKEKIEKDKLPPPAGFRGIPPTKISSLDSTTKM